MNARERAEQICDDLNIAMTEVYRKAVVEAIEQAIIVAEEESAKREREACAKVVDKQTKGWSGHLLIGRILQDVKDKIRARSEGEQQQSKGE